MSSYLDGIPQAVATIVSACYDKRLTGVNVPAHEQDAAEKRILDFTNQLTRTFAKALIDAQSGKP